MNDSPLVSVLMTAYNEEKLINEAIDSILNQTYSNFEFIIINDGSIDSTEEIILSYSDPRIVYVKNDVNLKLIRSLNKGLEMAKGKYIARMDSDDISLPHRLQRQVQYMEANPEIGISGAQLIVFGTEDTTMNYPLVHEDLKIRLLTTSCYPNNLVIFRKVIMDKYNLRFPEGYLHAEDYKFWTQWLEITKGSNLNEYLVKYRFHPNSVSHLYKNIQKQTILRVRIEYLIQLFDLSEVNKEYIANNFYGNDYKKRVSAIKYILARNFESKVFNPDKLENAIFKLWYLDALAEIPTNKFIFLNYTRIFTLSFFKNLKYWEYILKGVVKHTLKLLNRN